MGWVGRCNNTPLTCLHRWDSSWFHTDNPTMWHVHTACRYSSSASEITILCKEMLWCVVILVFECRRIVCTCIFIRPKLNTHKCDRKLSVLDVTYFITAIKLLMSLFSSSLCYSLVRIKSIKTDVSGPPLSFISLSNQCKHVYSVFVFWKQFL